MNGPRQTNQSEIKQARTPYIHLHTAVEEAERQSLLESRQNTGRSPDEERLGQKAR